jgi:hypothetical protein
MMLLMDHVVTLNSLKDDLNDALATGRVDLNEVRAIQDTMNEIAAKLRRHDNPEDVALEDDIAADLRFRINQLVPEIIEQ